VASGGTSTVGGGEQNTSSGQYATVGGGLVNYSSGTAATVPGGWGNQAVGDYSFAAGFAAQANHDGAFVWADASTSSGFGSTTSNQFAVRATGGVQLATGSGTGLTMNGQNVTFSNSTTTFVTGVGSLAIVADAPVPGITASSPTFSGHMRLRNALEIWPNAGVATNGGSLDIRALNGVATISMSGTNGNITCTSLTQTSDRNAKQDFAPVCSAQILDKVARLPISQWSYKQDAATRHLGPMAQDFYSLFNVGPDDKHIAVVDEGGVALAAIQGLNQKLEERATTLERWLERAEAENTQLKQEVATLKELVNSINRKLDEGAR
jgi:hypothetical protein